MKQFKKVLVSFALVIGLGFTLGLAVPANAYEVNTEFKLGPGEGSPYRAYDQYVIIHETANATATGRNEATYMKRNWFNAFTTYIVGDGIVYQVGEPGYISYGAGSANSYAPVQIELQHTLDPNLFAQNYKVYIDLIRDSANRFGIPLTLDAGGAGTPGVKSHLWVSNNIWGDHTDPYGYLASMGVSKEKFVYDIANGVNGPIVTPPTKPAEPAKPNKPAQYEVKTWNKMQITDVNGLQIRTSPTSASTSIGSLFAGQKFNATKIATNGQNVNGYTSWFEVDGKGWVSGAYVTEVKDVTPAPTPAPSTGVKAWNKPQVVDVNGLNIRAAQTANSQVVGQLNAGETFTATRVMTNGQNVNGYTTWFEVNGRGWVSGAYVTETGATQNIATSGSYTTTGVQNIRSGAGLGYAVVGQYASGETFFYDSKVVADGYTWLHYISYSGQHRYVAQL